MPGATSARGVGGRRPRGSPLWALRGDGGGKRSCSSHSFSSVLGVFFHNSFNLDLWSLRSSQRWGLSFLF